MGDAIIENTWDGEHEIDLAKKFDSEEEYDDDSVVGEETAAPINSKKEKKKRRLEQAKQNKKLKLESDAKLKQSEIESSENKAPPSLTEKQMLELLKKHRPKVGVDEISLTEENFGYPELVDSATTKSATNKRVCPFVRALSVNMPNYKKHLLHVDVPKDDYGCPLLLVLCSGAIRATEIIKSVCAKLIKCRIAKLFAKHFKVEEQMELLKKSYYPVAIGTPNRVKKLIEVGALSLRKCVMVLVDITPDLKTFTILNLQGVQQDFYSLLTQHIQTEKSHLKVTLIAEHAPLKKEKKGKNGEKKDDGNASKNVKKDAKQPTLPTKESSVAPAAASLSNKRKAEAEATEEESEGESDSDSEDDDEDSDEE